jgi:hypothetical protein
VLQTLGPQPWSTQAASCDYIYYINFESFAGIYGKYYAGGDTLSSLKGGNIPVPNVSVKPVADMEALLSSAGGNIMCCRQNI